MKQFLVKPALIVALCMCIATTLFITIPSAKTAHAATTRAEPCQVAMIFSPGSTLNQGQSYTINHICTDGNSLTLIVQWDDNMVLYCNSSAIWASGTWNPNPAGAYATFQTDGNFVIYAQYDDAPTIWHPVWASNTWHEGGQYLVLQSDGNLVMYQSSNGYNNFTNPIWATNTGGDC